MQARVTSNIAQGWRKNGMCFTIHITKEERYFTAKLALEVQTFRGGWTLRILKQGKIHECKGYARRPSRLIETKDSVRHLYLGVPTCKCYAQCLTASILAIWPFFITASISLSFSAIWRSVFSCRTNWRNMEPNNSTGASASSSRISNTDALFPTFASLGLFLCACNISTFTLLQTYKMNRCYLHNTATCM